MFKDLIFAGTGYGLAVVAGLMFLDAREDLASEVERCNTAVAQSAAEAERLTRQVERDAASRELLRLARQVELEREAREIAERATREALARPQRVREVIRNSDETCLDTVIPADILDSLHD